jgi:flagellar L-ring protein precursor FlgH
MTRAATLIVYAAAGGVLAQSLYQRPAAPPVSEYDEPEPAAVLREYSYLYLEPPKPATFDVHDLITIIIDENSRQSSEQSLETEKEGTLQVDISQFPSLPMLAEMQLENGIGTPIEVDLTGTREYEGDGSYERSDRIQDRIQAEVVDVKPNGTLVLEARAFRDSNGESQLVVLSGVCRREDVTTSNTVMSSQLANKVLIIENEGEIDDAASKGWITRVLDTVFAF